MEGRGLHRHRNKRGGSTVYLSQEISLPKLTPFFVVDSRIYDNIVQSSVDLVKVGSCSILTNQFCHAKRKYLAQDI